MATQTLSKTVLATGISSAKRGFWRDDVLEAQAYLQAANNAFEEGDEETAEEFRGYSEKIVDRIIA